MTNKSTSYNKITIKIVLSILLITLGVSFIYSEYIKDEVIVNLAKIDAKKTSRLVFEAMYSAMQKGWNKDDIQEIIDRLNKVDDKLEISIYRGENVAFLYGDIQKDKEVRESNLNVKKAFNGTETIDIVNTDEIRYFFPIVANNKCQTCHTNVIEGDVLGVINVNYPITELKISLNDIINIFLLFIVSFSILIIVLLFINFNKYLIKPIESFIATANKIKKSSDITQRVKIDGDINEIQSMQTMFNEMLDSIEYQFYYDDLTKLRNRKALLEDLEEHKEILFMIINLDKFQQINNLYGDEVGDKILLIFKEKLTELLPSSFEIYKMHADEFGVVSYGDVDLKEFENIASFIISNLSSYNYELFKDKCIIINLTIGISHGSTLLLPNADMALKLAKKGKKQCLTYNEEMITLKEYENRIKWVDRITSAIENDKIVPIFQAIVDHKTDKTVKYEALMRIKESDNDFIAPIHFLDIAKENKLYFKLTKIMLEKSFIFSKQNNVKLSINLTKDDMTNESIVEFIIKELKDGNFAHNITFEILESEGIENFDEIKLFIKKVKKYGVSISIDDFGTGYSNFEYLMSLDFDYLKIDASMIKNIDKDKKSQMVTKTIIDFAHKIDVKTVAEFVSSKAIYEKTKAIGIDYAQGYYIGEPKENIDIENKIYN